MPCAPDYSLFAGIVCDDFSAKDSTNSCENLKAVTRTTALICKNEISLLRGTCDDANNADSRICDCFSYSPYSTCLRLESTLSLINYYPCEIYVDTIRTNLAAMVTTQVDHYCQPELKLIRKANDICETTTVTKIPICDLVPDSPNLISCDELPVYLRLKLPKGDEKCRSKSNVLLSAKRVCLPELGSLVGDGFCLY